MYKLDNKYMYIKYDEDGREYLSSEIEDYIQSGIDYLCDVLIDVYKKKYNMSNELHLKVEQLTVTKLEKDFDYHNALEFVKIVKDESCRLKTKEIILNDLKKDSSFRCYIALQFLEILKTEDSIRLETEEIITEKLEENFQNNAYNHDQYLYRDAFNFLKIVKDESYRSKVEKLTVTKLEEHFKNNDYNYNHYFYYDALNFLKIVKDESCRLKVAGHLVDKLKYLDDEKIKEFLKIADNDIKIQNLVTQKLKSSDDPEINKTILKCLKVVENEKIRLELEELIAQNLEKDFNYTYALEFLKVAKDEECCLKIADHVVDNLKDLSDDQIIDFLERIQNNNILLSKIKHADIRLEIEKIITERLQSSDDPEIMLRFLKIVKDEGCHSTTANRITQKLRHLHYNEIPELLAIVQNDTLFSKDEWCLKVLENLTSDGILYVLNYFDRKIEMELKGNTKHTEYTEDYSRIKNHVISSCLHKLTDDQIIILVEDYHKNLDSILENINTNQAFALLDFYKTDSNSVEKITAQILKLDNKDDNCNAINVTIKTYKPIYRSLLDELLKKKKNRQAIVDDYKLLNHAMNGQMSVNFSDFLKEGDNNCLLTKDMYDANAVKNKKSVPLIEKNNYICLSKLTNKIKQETINRNEQIRQDVYQNLLLKNNENSEKYGNIIKTIDLNTDYLDFRAIEKIITFKPLVVNILNNKKNTDSDYLEYLDLLDENIASFIGSDNCPFQGLQNLNNQVQSIFLAASEMKDKDEQRVLNDLIVAFLPKLTQLINEYVMSGQRDWGNKNNLVYINKQFLVSSLKTSITTILKDKTKAIMQTFDKILKDRRQEVKEMFPKPESNNDINIEADNSQINNKSNNSINIEANDVNGNSNKQVAIKKEEDVVTPESKLFYDNVNGQAQDLVDNISVFLTLHTVYGDSFAQDLFKKRFEQDKILKRLADDIINQTKVKKKGFLKKISSFCFSCFTKKDKTQKSSNIDNIQACYNKAFNSLIDAEKVAQQERDNRKPKTEKKPYQEDLVNVLQGSLTYDKFNEKQTTENLTKPQRDILKFILENKEFITRPVLNTSLETAFGVKLDKKIIGFPEQHELGKESKKITYNMRERKKTAKKLEAIIQSMQKGEEFDIEIAHEEYVDVKNQVEKNKPIIDNQDQQDKYGDEIEIQVNTINNFQQNDHEEIVISIPNQQQPKINHEIDILEFYNNMNNKNSSKKQDKESYEDITANARYNDGKTNAKTIKIPIPISTLNNQQPISSPLSEGSKSLSMDNEDIDEKKHDINFYESLNFKSMQQDINFIQQNEASFDSMPKDIDEDIIKNPVHNTKELLTKVLEVD